MTGVQTCALPILENDTVGAKTAEEAAEAEAHLADEASESENADSNNVDFE